MQDDMNPLEGYNIIPSDYWGLCLVKDGIYYYYTISGDGSILYEGFSNILVNNEDMIKQIDEIN